MKCQVCGTMNSERETMIKALFETAYRLKEKQDKVIN